MLWQIVLKVQCYRIWPEKYYVPNSIAKALYVTEFTYLWLLPKKLIFSNRVLHLLYWWFNHKSWSKSLKASMKLPCILPKDISACGKKEPGTLPLYRLSHSFHRNSSFHFTALTIIILLLFSTKHKVRKKLMDMSLIFVGNGPANFDLDEKLKDHQSD